MIGTPGCRVVSTIIPHSLSSRKTFERSSQRYPLIIETAPNGNVTSAQSQPPHPHRSDRSRSDLTTVPQTATPNPPPGHPVCPLSRSKQNKYHPTVLATTLAFCYVLFQTACDVPMCVRTSFLRSGRGGLAKGLRHVDTRLGLVPCGCGA